MALERMSHSPELSDFMELAGSKGIVIGPSTRVMLRLMELLREYLASAAVHNDTSSEAASSDTNKEGAILRMEAQVLIVSLTRILQRLLPTADAPSDTTAGEQAELKDMDEVLKELEVKIHKTAASFGLRAEEMISLDLEPLGPFQLTPRVR